MFRRTSRHSFLALALVAGAAQAQEPAYDFNLPPQPVSQLLAALARQTGLNVAYPRDAVKGIQSPGVKGRYPLKDALAVALSGTGLTFEFTGEKAVRIQVAKTAEVGKVVEIWGEGAYTTSKATTGTKTDTPLMETPVNIQVVPRQVLEDQQIDSLSRALVNVSGIVANPKPSFNDAFNIAGEYVTLRGFKSNSSGGGNSSVLVDGSKVDGLSGTVQMANVESVEVLKGPAAVLYGRMEPGGVVNTVLKKPLDASYQSFEAVGGSWGTYRAHLDSTGPITADKSLLYRVNVSYGNAGSWREGDIYSRPLFIAPSLLWKIGPQTSLGLDLTYTRIKAGEDTTNVAPWLNDRPDVIPWSRNLGEPSPSTNTTKSFSLKLEHGFNSNWSLKTKVQHVQNDFHGVLVAPDFLFSSGGGWTVLRDKYWLNLRTRGDSASADLVGHVETFGLKHTLLAGADYRRLISSTPRQQTDWGNPSTLDALNPDHPGTPFVPDPTMDSFFDGKNLEAGQYIQDQVELPHDVFITLGARRQRYGTDYGSVYPNLGIVGSSARKESKTTPRYGIVWRTRPWLSLYGSYTESFGASSGEIYPGTPMPPTNAKQYEGGLKAEFLGGKVHATVAYFDLTKTNIAKLDPDPTHLPAYRWSVPIGEVRSKGVEFDLQGELLPGWNTILTYANTDARINKDATATWQEGDRMDGVPRNMASFWMTYAFRGDTWQGLKLGVGASWRDKTYLSRPSAADTQKSLTPGYSLVNAMASYGFKSGSRRWTAQINVDNLFDKKYWSWADNSWSPEMAFISYGSPRSVTASLKVEF